MTALILFFYFCILFKKISMRIGFDAKRLYNNFTGLGNYSRTLVGNLSAFYPGDEYCLYTPTVRHTPETEMFLNEMNYRTVVSHSPLKAYWRGCSVKKNLKQDHIDIYHGLSHEVPLNIHKSGIRSVVTIHDIIYKTYPDMFTSIDRAIYDMKFRYSCKHADKVIAISEQTKRDIISYFGTSEDKIEVIYQAINPIFYQMQEMELATCIVEKFQLPKDYLLYVGSINSRKNLMSIVMAMKLLPRDLQLPLVIVGQGGQYKQDTLKYAIDNKLDHLLIWVNNLSDSRTLQAFYQRARMLIFPSVYEGFGLPVTEALLSGTPVITSNVSSLPEAGGPNSYYVSPMDIEQIARGIETILTDDTLRIEMIEKGFHFAQAQFMPKRLTEQVHQLYQNLASCKS